MRQFTEKNTSDFIRSKNYLDDLRLLISPYLSDLLDNLESSFFLDEDLKTHRAIFDNYPFLIEHFVSFMKNELSKLSRGVGKVHEVEIKKQDDPTVLLNIVKFMRLCPQVMKVISFIEFLGSQKTTIDSELIVLEGKFRGKNFNSEEISEIKKLSKNLLNDKIIMVYDIDIDSQNMINTVYAIKFKFYFAQHENMKEVLKFPYLNEKKYFWSISSIFQHFVVRQEDYDHVLKKSDKFLIEQNLDVKNITYHQCKEILSDKYTLFYIPFMFRPLSLIIEGQFERSNVSTFFTLFKSCDHLRQVSYFDLNSDMHLFYLDFFSLYTSK